MFAIKTIKKWIKNNKEIAFLLLFGFCYRLLLVACYPVVTKWPDSWSFMELSSYLHQFKLSGYTGERSLGYPLLIAFLGNNTMWLTIIWQYIIASFTFIIWYKTIVKLNFSKKNSLLITLFLETLLYVFFYESAILIESITVLFFAIIAYIVADDYFNKKSLQLELFFGCILAYLTLIKPFYAYIPFLIYGFSVVYNFSYKKIINQKIIIVLFTLIAYFGWSYVNKINTGYFVSTTYFGLNISQNCVYFAEKSSEKYQWISKPYVQARERRIITEEDVAMSVWEAHEKKLKYIYPNFAECSYYLGEYAKETIKNNPKEYIKQVIFKSWLDFWKIEIYWNYDQFSIPYSKYFFNGIWKIQRTILYGFKFTFLGLVLFYFIQFFRKRKITFEIVITTLIFSGSLLQGIVTYGTNAKYAYPYEFLMVLVVLLFIKKETKILSKIKANVPKPIHIVLQRFYNYVGLQ